MTSDPVWATLFAEDGRIVAYSVTNVHLGGEEYWLIMTPYTPPENNIDNSAYKDSSVSVVYDGVSI